MISTKTILLLLYYLCTCIDCKISLIIDTIQVDAMVVGSHFKLDGKWFNDLDKSKVDQFMNTWTTSVR